MVAIPYFYPLSFLAVNSSSYLFFIILFARLGEFMAFGILQKCLDWLSYIVKNIKIS